jgi:hypothetical protein
MIDREKLNYITNILNLSNKDLDVKLLYNVFTAMQHNPNLEDDILDSFSDNQVKAKSRIVDNLDKLNLLNEDTEVVIWGCWYGSVLIPLLHDKVKKITAFDLDSDSITVGHNQILKDYNKVTWITADVFDDYRNQYYDNCDLVINTSCEHMPPMKEWGVMNPSRGEKYKNPWWTRVNPNAHFAFTSNDMFDIEGHTNCVNNIEDFKLQLPDGSTVLIEDELVDERGTRFMLIGKL